MHEVHCNDKAPCSPASDRSGQSLWRLDLTAFADDPVNWTALPPPPVSFNTGPT